MAALALLVASPAASDLRLERHARGDSIHVAAWLDVDAPASDVWDVVTDYNGMSRFVPGLKRSQRIGRTPEGPVVEQEGVSRVFLVGTKVRTRLQMSERPKQMVAFRALSGDLKPFTGAWEVMDRPGGRSRLGCQCTLARKSGMRASFMAWIAGEELRPRLRALGREAERRARDAGRSARPRPWFWPF